MKLPNLREGSAPEEQYRAGDDAQNQARADGREKVGRETKDSSYDTSGLLLPYFC